MSELMVIVAALLVGLVQLFVGLGLAVFAIYMGINILDRLTVGIEEMNELKKGNIAVGLMLAAVVISIALVIQSGLMGMTNGIAAAGDDFVEIAKLIGKGLISVIVGMIFAVIGIYIAIWVMKKILAGTPIERVVEKVSKQKIVKNLDLMEELRNGNIAVGVMLSGILIAVGVVIQAGVQGIVEALGVV